LLRALSERVGEKYLAVKTLKGWIELKEQHPRVTQHGRGGLHLPLPSTEFDAVRRGVVLKLFRRLELVAAGRDDWRLADAVPPAKTSQCRIRQFRPAGHQFLMDSHEIPLAVAEKLQDAFPVRFGLLGSVQFRDLGCLRPQHFAHCRTGDSQHARNLPPADPLCV